jgi:hypothetical protein
VFEDNFFLYFFISANNIPALSSKDIQNVWPPFSNPKYEEIVHIAGRDS